MKVEASPARPVRSGDGEGSSFAAASASHRNPGREGPERLLVVARELTRGGAAYLALRHARHLSGRYAVDVLVTGPCDEGFLKEFPAEIPVYRLGGSALPREADWPRVLHRFAREHAHLPPFRRQYRALLATSTFPDLAACAAVSTVRASRRLLFLVDESLYHFHGVPQPARDVVEQCVLSTDLVLPVSRRLWGHMAVLCPPLRGRPWHRLPPPVEVEAILARAREPQTAITPGPVPSVLTIGRLSPEKQIPMCVRVHHRLKQAGVRFRWYVVGTGHEGPQVVEEIRALGMEDDFILLGNRENVYSIMSACDVFALFSLSEGCPTVVLEALTLGRPVIMTEVNGAEEMVEHGTTGLVVANDPDAIASGLARVVQDAGLRGRFRENLAARAGRRDPGAERRTLPDLIEAAGPPLPPPRVSVLIPTYNQAGVIGRAVASALAQDYPWAEVVVLDDASTDGTGEAAGAWAFDRRFRYVRNERNLGRVANYHRGLTEHARGEWVVMLDGDDYFTDPGFLRRAFEAVDRHADRKVVFAQAGHRVHHPDGRWPDADVLPMIQGPERLLPGAEYLRFVFETGFFTHLGAVYRREAAVRCGFYTAPISSTDMDSLLRLALDGEVLLLNQIAGCWVQHGGNASARLTLAEFAPNVRVFRKAARRAVRMGLAAWRDLSGPLARYEARTLVYLFDAMNQVSPRGPRDLARFLAAALSVNPALLRDGLFLSACRRYARTLVQPALARRAPGRLALRVLRRLRAAYRGLGGKPLTEALAR